VKDLHPNIVIECSSPEPNIRVTVLSNLGERFDKYLAQAENVRLLFMALNDEQYEVRTTTTVIIGRLAHHNPAHVMPSLRKTLVQLLTEMEYTGVS
jgi:FKBP12-rapamycin complex-associated protein